MALTTQTRRVRALEDGSGGGGGGGGWDGDDCNHCGWPHYGSGDGDDIRYEVVWDEDDEETCCPHCGREFLTIYFHDDPRAPWNRGEQA